MGVSIVIGVLAVGFAALYYFMQQAAANGPSSGVTPEVPSDGGATTGVTSSASPGSTLDSKVAQLARAIALAEGANLAGSVPFRYGNPGDLSVGDDYFGTATGSVVLPDSEHLLTFTPGPTWDSGDGWDALNEKVRRWLTGASATYPLTASFTDVAKKYAGNWQPWLRNVTSYIGVTPEATLSDYVQA